MSGYHDDPPYIDTAYVEPREADGIRIRAGPLSDGPPMNDRSALQPWTADQDTGSTHGVATKEHTDVVALWSTLPMTTTRQAVHRRSESITRHTSTDSV